MSINVELALVLGLFLIGAMVLAVDNLADALYRRVSLWIRERKSIAATAESPSLRRKNKS
jgi:hypothetical protein